MRAVVLGIVLVGTGLAHAGPGQVVHVRVQGELDRAAVGEALGRELGVEVELVDHDCSEPCLTIAIDGRATVTVMYVPRAGAPRARAVRLDRDRAQWPLIVTLLAGNVVRDEADDVLAGLPPAGHAPAPAAPAAPAALSEPPAPAALSEPPTPAAPPPGAPPPVPVVAPPIVAAGSPASGELAPPVAHRAFRVGLFPLLSTDLAEMSTLQHSVSFDALIGVSRGTTGLALSGLLDVQLAEVKGAQIGGLAAFAPEVTGVQLGGTLAWAGESRGLQIGGVAAITTGGARTQLAGALAVAHGEAHTQVAGVASVADVAFTQLAGVVNAADRAHVQLAGVVNAADRARVQVAGVVNAASHVNGLQLGLINVARHVDGVQVGLINVGGSVDGFSFGLINVVPGGRTDLETAVDTSATGTLVLRHGSRRWHNVYGFAGQRVDEPATSTSSDDLWMYGLGFGPTLELGTTRVDIETIGWEVNHGARHERNVSLLGQLRVTVAQPVGPVAIVVGAAWNTYVTNDAQSPLLLERMTGTPPTDTGVTVTMWPTAFVGLRL